MLKRSRAKSSIIFKDDTFRFVAVDVETANRHRGSICQIGLAMVANDGHILTFGALIDPEEPFDTGNTSIHGIDDQTVAGAITFPKILHQLRPFLERHTLIQHSSFDRGAFDATCEKYGIPKLRANWTDSVRIARKAWPELKGNGGHGLASLKTYLKLKFEHHDAEDDAWAAAEIVRLAETQTGLSFSELGKSTKQKYQKPVSLNGNQNGALYGHAVCFTGTLELSREEAATLAAGAGMDVKTSVSKKVTVLVVGDQDLSTLAGHKKSSKHRNAEKLQETGHPIRILCETEFLELIQIF